MANFRLLVVEDDEFTRQLLVNLLQNLNFDVIIETSSAPYALKMAPPMKIDAALLDLNLGSGPTGLDLALGLRRHLPAIGLTFLTSFKDPRFLESRSELAPHGSEYLEKKSISDFNKIKRTIEKSILAGKKSSSGAVLKHKTLGMPSELTTTQIRILHLLAQGKTNQEIAEIREISEKSVEQTLSRILKKIDPTSTNPGNKRIELALYFFRQTGILVDDFF